MFYDAADTVRRTCSDAEPCSPLAWALEHESLYRAGLRRSRSNPPLLAYKPTATNVIAMVNFCPFCGKELKQP